MNELLYGNSNGAVVTETEKSDVGDDEAESKVETENNDETERSLIVDMHPIQAQLEQMEIETTTELENANTPIPALGKDLSSFQFHFKIIAFSVSSAC